MVDSLTHVLNSLSDNACRDLDLIGYSGPSARLVWKAIQEENCFGGDGDVCLEKRIFHR